MSEYISTSEGVDVRSRAEELGLQSPERFSIVPSGLSKAESVDDLLHQDEAITIRKVINREGVEETPIDEGVPLDTYHATNQLRPNQEVVSERTTRRITENRMQR